jgi:hypothetical protein
MDYPQTYQQWQECGESPESCAAVRLGWVTIAWVELFSPPLPLPAKRGWVNSPLPNLWGGAGESMIYGRRKRQASVTVAYSE